MNRSLRLKLSLSIVVLLLAVVSLVCYGPIPQDDAYHHFADHRTILGVGNFWNVVSNIPFLVIGAAGLGLSALLFYPFASRVRIDEKAHAMRCHYVTFFTGLILTGLGSSYYHLEPNGTTLVWDRLPMTIAFMGFFCLVIGYHASVKVARVALLPAVSTGALSVAYWVYTESIGAGDLRFYALVQFLPIVLIPLIVEGSESKQLTKRSVWIIILFYAAAKFLEHFDQFFYTTLHLVSGHSLKHLIASFAGVVIVIHLSKQIKSGESKHDIS